MTQVRKIAFNHDIFPCGGAERVTLDIAKYITQSNPNYKFYVFAYRITEELLTEEWTKYLTIIKVRGKRKLRYKDIEEAVLREGIELIVQVVKPLKYIEKIKARTGCKTIFANHGVPFSDEYVIIKRRSKSKLFKPLWNIFWRRCYEDWGLARRVAINRTKSIYKSVDAYMVLCETYKSIICKEIGINPENSKITAIENSEKIVPDVNYNKEKIILFCGRLENISKRLDRLLRIWGKVQHKLPDYRLVIVGDGVARKDMEKQIADEKLERVDMEGFQTNVEKYYRKASIVCLTSQHEGWPLCLTEGQAHGCIDIAFECTAGIREILSPSGVNGFIIGEPFDEDEYAETLLRIAAMSDEEREVIRRNAVAKRAQYAPEIIIAKWTQLFESVLK